MPIHHQQQQTIKLIWSNNFSSLKRKVHKLAQNFQFTPARKGSTSDKSNANMGLE